ncbi:hypothetical protein [Amphibacillus sediminis]|uniref:hypothetical protein n=1 Tax=Amphibacillus sediminis TaxID=360185 RepID=UPI00083225B0|nr:hypothetical protein [Amphibacillus sediminis]
MQNLKKVFYVSIILLLLAGCAGRKDEEPATDPSGSTLEAANGQTIEPDQSESHNKQEESKSDHEQGNTSDQSIDYDNDSNVSSKQDSEALAQYSSEQIEYARVWLQLGPNQEVDELNVRHISAGELINPNDDTSARYPEDVIQLSGSRSIDGSVTYSGNGDGTINVYNVPLRWESPADVDENFMQEYTKDIIEHTELVNVNLGSNQEVIKLINVLNVSG